MSSLARQIVVLFCIYPTHQIHTVVDSPFFRLFFYPSRLCSFFKTLGSVHPLATPQTNFSSFRKRSSFFRTHLSQCLPKKRLASLATLLASRPPFSPSPTSTSLSLLLLPPSTRPSTLCEFARAFHASEAPLLTLPSAHGLVSVPPSFSSTSGCWIPSSSVRSLRIMWRRLQSTRPPTPQRLTLFFSTTTRKLTSIARVPRYPYHLPLDVCDGRHPGYGTMDYNA